MASGLHHLLYEGQSWALAVLSQKSIILLMLPSCGVSFGCFCPQLSLPFGCYSRYCICAYLLWGSQRNGAWWVPLKGLSWLPSRLACSSLQFHQAPPSHPSIVNGFNASSNFAVYVHDTMLVALKTMTAPHKLLNCTTAIIMFKKINLQIFTHSTEVQWFWNTIKVTVFFNIFSFVASTKQHLSMVS